MFVHALTRSIVRFTKLNANRVTKLNRYARNTHSSKTEAESHLTWCNCPDQCRSQCCTETAPKSSSPWAESTQGRCSHCRLDRWSRRRLPIRLRTHAPPTFSWSKLLVKKGVRICSCSSLMKRCEIPGDAKCLREAQAKEHKDTRACVCILRDIWPSIRFQHT